MNDTPHRMPWDAPLPAAVPETLPPAQEMTLEQVVASMREDFAYAVLNTCVVVHSSNPKLKMAANTARGQIVPHGAVRFTDGTTVEFQDIGMCQPGVPHMSVHEIISRVLAVAKELGLERWQQS